MFLLYAQAFGTHNRAGEITYMWIGSNTIQATITTCTKTSSPADRDFLELYWGDGQMDTLYRDNAAIIYYPTYDMQKNTYTGTHTYTGMSTFELYFVDPNRNASVLNINNGNSVNEPFAVGSQLALSAFGASYNNSVQFLECPCPEIGCINKPYYYIPGAYDPDGDSLSYELIACWQDLFVPVTNYDFPVNMSIDPVTGIVSWLNPTQIGEYNIAIKITEWREGKKVGSVTRDLQIIISNCVNDPPDIAPLNDTCVEAGTSLSFDVVTTDPDAADVITLTANGQPFILPTSPAFMSGPTTGGSPLTTTFVWNTDCDHISSTPYQVYFIAEDDDSPGGQAPLTDIESMFITVVAPAPTGLTVQPLGNSMILNWNQGMCGDIIGYKIYRRIDSSMVAPNCCESTSLESLGFTYVGSTSNVTDTSFVDNSPLVIGELYCYVIVACYDDGGTSCPSAEACATLLHDVPVITHVSVVSTNVTTGTDSICWSKPTELDTVQFPGPYHFRIYRTNGFTGAGSLLAITPLRTNWYLFNDTCYEDLGVLNTLDSAYNYRIELYYTDPISSNDSLVGSSNTGSSIYLTLTPNDNQLGLSWYEDVPWTNTSYDVYKSIDGGTIYNYLATTTAQSYVDSGLVNGATYCYKIKSTGGYSLPEIVSPIINWSQEACGQPWDYTPPCAPTLIINADCAGELNSLTWNNPNNSCADDVVGYNLYYTPTEGGTPELIATFNSANDTTYTHNNNGSIAGCYWITAIDSAIYGNESEMSVTVCVDNCPHYSLPNVFTPNGDGDNDWFIPFPYQYVDSVDCKIFNRWGNLLFETNDPDIWWDGTAMESGEPVPEGVYYYLCVVYTITLQGIEPVELSGFMHLFRGNTNFGQ